MPTLAHSCTLLHTLAYSCTLLHTLAHLCTPLHTLAHSCTPLHAQTRTHTQHIHTPSYSNLVPRPSRLQFSFACSMLKRREKAWGFLHHMLSAYMYIHTTNLAICASYEGKQTCMTSGRQRVDMTGAVPDHCHTQTLR